MALCQICQTLLPAIRTALKALRPTRIKKAPKKTRLRGEDGET